jgi:hypothetical protein
MLPVGPLKFGDPVGVERIKIAEVATMAHPLFAATGNVALGPVQRCEFLIADCGPKTKWYLEKPIFSYVGVRSKAKALVNKGHL